MMVFFIPFLLFPQVLIPFPHVIYVINMRNVIATWSKFYTYKTHIASSHHNTLSINE